MFWQTAKQEAKTQLHQKDKNLKIKKIKNLKHRLASVATPKVGAGDAKRENLQ